MKRISIIGSTGSIGTQALDVIENSPDMCVSAIAVYKNIKLAEKQIRKFRPGVAAVFSEECAPGLRAAVKDTDTRVLSGMEGLREAAAVGDMCLTAVSGSVGILPTVDAISAGLDIALANKETMVCAGDIINQKAKEHGVKIRPVDSEHGAIFQCIGNEKKSVRKILLTASGGPFYGNKREELKIIKACDALKHPNWDMGAKITIDSATLMNKGLEVIEAVRLFGVAPSQIEVLIHRQSIIHSMVEFCDNSVIAQLGAPDMRLPIAYALNYPKRRENSSDTIDFLKTAPLTFDKPDTETFRGLALAYSAIEEGGTMPAVYNGANDAAAHAFLRGECGFLDIAEITEAAMAAHKSVINPDLSSIIEADGFGRSFAENKIKKGLTF